MKGRKKESRIQERQKERMREEEDRKSLTVHSKRIFTEVIEH